MPLVLRPGLSWCLCAEQVVFLDLARDRYFCLPEALGEDFQHWASGEALGHAEQEALVAAGLLEPGEGEPLAATRYQSARRDLAIEHKDIANPVDVLIAAAGQLRARRWLRRRQLLDIAASLAQCRAPRQGKPNDETRLHEIARAFLISAALVRAADQCLPRAIAAYRLCLRHGIDAAMIFGVRLHPFAAHSWVQVGDAVVVGDLEQVRLYAPILVLP